MKKITELKIDRMATREVKDESGKRVRKKVRVSVNRSVRVVSGGLRFAHYFIDGIIISLLFYPIDWLIGLFGPFEIHSIGYAIFIGIFPITLSYPLYYFVMEYLLQTTPGKMLNKAIVINEYGQKPTASELIKRSIIRLVPFEPFSCLGERGWHDTWSKTWVVTREEAGKLQELLNREKE